MQFILKQDQLNVAKNCQKGVFSLTATKLKLEREVQETNKKDFAKYSLKEAMAV